MKINKILKTVIFVISLLLLVTSLTLTVSAEEEIQNSEFEIQNQESVGTGFPDGPSTADAPVGSSYESTEKQETPSSTANAVPLPLEGEGSLPSSNDISESIETNPFEEIYNLGVENADKIFSVLAFLGTLIVSIGYKSGLYPLLRDALSRLKSAIDTAKEENDKNCLTTSEKINELSKTVESIGETLKKQSEEISRIEWQFESYEDLVNERRALKTTLLGQMDMLYAIFMSSSLPQYQKDEIGEKIAQIREELKSYEVIEN